MSVHLYHRERGTCTRPPLIILHGLWGASDNWLGVARLLEKDFHVFLPDLRNHGRSPHAGPSGYPQMKQDVLEWMSGLGLERKPFMAGHSMGGKVLMHLLLENPGLVSRAAVIDIFPESSPREEAEVHRRLLDFALGFTLSSCHSLQAVRREIRGVLGDEDRAQILFKNLRHAGGCLEWKMNLAAVRRSLDGLMGWESAGVPCTEDVLFVRGENSPYTTPSFPPALPLLFPKARLLTIAGCGHRIHAEAPEALAEALRIHFLAPLP